MYTKERYVILRHRKWCPEGVTFSGYQHACWQKTLFCKEKPKQVSKSVRGYLERRSMVEKNEMV